MEHEEPPENQGRVPKCPKCGCKDMTLTELWRDHSIQFTLINGDLRGGIMEPGDAYRVEAECSKCHHEWKLKGIRHAGELRSWEGFIPLHEESRTSMLY